MQEDATLNRVVHLHYQCALKLIKYKFLKIIKQLSET